MEATLAAEKPRPAPEQGQLVRLRNRLWFVRDAIAHESADGSPITRLELECLDDDLLGRELSVLWEREVNTEVLLADAFPRPSGRWDHPHVFRDFLTALRWSSSSVLAGAALQSPFRGGIELEPYQLEPAARALTMPRVNLLIADDVGLGKTIEAGLVLQELLARARVRNCLILCPASLQRQWQEEMAEKFNLDFHIIDRAESLQLRREYGVHVNPWSSFPRLITSVDYLKRGSVMNQFVSSLEHDGRSGLSSWDLLILDEAHNCAPAGRQRYIRDSDRTRMLRQIAPHFQHRLFLTATPHNGFTESFTALLEQLDPLRFHRGPEVDPEQVEVIMIRRMKEQLIEGEGSLRFFAKRKVDALRVPGDPEEEKAQALLESYIRSRIARATAPQEKLPVQFALTMLKKRFLSSPLAFHRSMETHLDNVTRPGRVEGTAERDAALMEQLVLRTREDQSDDDAKSHLEDEALRETTRFFGHLTAEEDRWLAALWAWSGKGKEAEDRKLKALREWVHAHLQTAGAWNDERLIVFTEYRDTLEYLQGHFSQWLGDERILTLTGGMASSERESVKAAFQTPPSEHPARVLLATDAAAEGLNLQNHCRYMIHYEIPWNPNRLEQRNGRIDRHGQRAKEVFIYHFVHENRADSEFLRTVVEKVEKQRDDLGSVAAVIESSVEAFMLGDRSATMDRVKARKGLRDDVHRALWDNHRLKLLREQVESARREWNIYPATLRRVLDSALKLEGHPGLEPVQGELAGVGALLRVPPAAWGDRCASSVKDAQGRLLTLVFDPEHARAPDGLVRRDVRLVHLNHVLMQRAIASFRKNMFSLGLSADSRLHRVTYEEVPDAAVPGPLLVADTRLLAVGHLGQKLHEDIRTVAWVMDGERLERCPKDVLALLPEDNNFPAIPARLGERLSRMVSRHEGVLRAELARVAEVEEARVASALLTKSESETAEVRKMLDVRQREIRKRLSDIDKMNDQQLRFDFPDEEEQFHEDVRLLKLRAERLSEERKTLPAAIARRYELKDLRAFPLGVRFYLPRSVVLRGEL